MADLKQLRADFEARLPKGWAIERSKDAEGDDTYVDDLTQGAWLGWLLARSAVPAQASAAEVDVKAIHKAVLGLHRSDGNADHQLGFLYGVHRAAAVVASFAAAPVPAQGEQCARVADLIDLMQNALDWIDEGRPNEAKKSLSEAIAAAQGQQEPGR